MNDSHLDVGWRLHLPPVIDMFPVLPPDRAEATSPRVQGAKISSKHWTGTNKNCCKLLWNGLKSPTRLGLLLFMTCQPPPIGDGFFFGTIFGMVPWKNYFHSWTLTIWIWNQWLSFCGRSVVSLWCKGSPTRRVSWCFASLSDPRISHSPRTWCWRRALPMFGLGGCYALQHWSWKMWEVCQWSHATSVNCLWNLMKTIRDLHINAFTSVHVHCCIF